MFLKCFVDVQILSQNVVTKSFHKSCRKNLRLFRLVIFWFCPWWLKKRAHGKKKHEPKKPNKIYAVGSNQKLFGAPNEKQNGDSGRAIV